jgi:hypothetical protein
MDSSTPIDRLRAGDEALDRGLRGPGEEIALLRGAGWLADTADLDAAELCERLMQIGSASLSVARLYEGHANALALIADHATPVQRAAISDAVRRGALTGVWGADGARPVGIAGRGAQARLNGDKVFASGLGVVALAIVTARTPQGVQMVLVDARDPARGDPAAWDVDAMVGSASGRFVCDGLSAVQEQRLGPPGAMLTEPAFHGGVWRLAACYAGAMQRLAALCREAHHNASSCEPLAEARLGRIAIEAQTAELWAREAARGFDYPASTPETVMFTALFAREACEQAAGRLLDLVERQLGAQMHRRASEAGRIARDLRFFLRQAALDGKLALATRLWTGAAAQTQTPPLACLQGADHASTIKSPATRCGCGTGRKTGRYAQGEAQGRIARDGAHHDRGSADRTRLD